MVAVAFPFEIPALGNVLHGRDPATLRHGPVDDMHGAPVGRFEDAVGHLALVDVAQDRRDELLDVSLERPGLLAMSDDVAETTARLYDFCCKPIHVDIALVTDDHPRR